MIRHAALLYTAQWLWSAFRLSIECGGIRS